MSKLKNNITKIKDQIKNTNIKIVCASKYIDYQTIKKIYNLKTTHFGENRADELLLKKRQLKDLNITWHFIGHLQSNKVKQVINEIDYLHSLDRISLAKEIQKRRNKPLDVFIQLNLTDELSKSGIKEEQLNDFLKQLKKYDKINVVGLMTMGKLNDLSATEQAFKKLDQLAKTHNLPEKSMGMTDDYLIALKYKTTFLRLGRILIK